MSAHNRANWVALRTLRQVPKVVGETSAGDPVFEIRSVRLVLPGDASHFSRILACAQCGRDVRGPSVRFPHDLDHRANAVLCTECVKTLADPVSRAGQGHADVSDRQATESVSGNGAVTRNAEVPTDDVRLATMTQPTDELSQVLPVQQAQWEALVDRLAPEASAPSQDAPDSMVDGLVQRVSDVAEVDAHRLEPVPEEQAGQGASDMTRVTLDYEVERGRVEITRQLDAGTERLAQLVQTSSGRLQALEERVHWLAESVVSQLLELQTALQGGLADARPVTAAESSAADARMHDLEARADRSEVEMSELGELQAVLDGGLGELRSQIAQVGEAHKELASGQVELERRLDAVARAQVATSEHGSRRGGRRSAAVAAQAEAVSLAVEDLARRHREMRADVDTNTLVADAAAREAARASFQASAVAPMRRDVRALEEQLAAQGEVLATLGRSVERLRRKVAAQAPATKPKPRAKKG